MKSENVKTAVYVLYEISEMLSVSGLWAPDSSGYPLYSRALYWDEQKNRIGSLIGIAEWGEAQRTDGFITSINLYDTDAKCLIGESEQAQGALLKSSVSHTTYDNSRNQRFHLWGQQ